MIGNRMPSAQPRPVAEPRERFIRLSKLPISPHEEPDYIEDALAAERANAIARAMAAIRRGAPGRAHFILQRSFERQARIAGIPLR